ncbi:hypothetical protein N0V90_008422 [Kalmusia sp. IMI 367209]|nr:hypothetical protein N0V90_008422 [Kalmusia sp. IMI 367209]
MRLLKYEEDGALNIIDFDDDGVPPYAILSHTWGADEEEVTFTDLVRGDGKAERGDEKEGYEKISFCGKQAQQDNLQYFWVDTCCIDKTDKAELSQAIRSMFRWYQNATKCYVYLSDVSTRKRKLDNMLTEVIWEPTFRASRWFTRGWTLQELLAPRTVEFFSREWVRLGDKVSLKPLIHKITGISREALDGAPLSQFSVDERLRWKGDRETKREEDAWYSLSGILDVEIAPAYSEGAASAFKRLMDERHKLERCIQDIRHTDPRDDKKRIEETKGGLLADSYRWVLDNTTFKQWQQDQHSRLLWVKGDPGKGKTMLLCGIIDELYSSLPKSALLVYFFCQATDSRINSATAVLRGLLYMLVNQQTSLISHVRKKYDHAGQALFKDANAWLPVSYRIKWIISSRNWPSIEEQLERAGHKVRLSLELNAKSVATAVNIFIQQKVDQLAQEKQYKAEIRHAVLRHLTSNANDTFLWVALVCQALKATPKWNVLKKLALFPPGLDELYKQMMHQVSESDGAEIYQQVLASTIVLYRPVTIAELVALVEPLNDFVNDLDLVREIVGHCGSFLTLREDTIYFVHQSAEEYLFTKGIDKVFPHGIEAAHRAIFYRSLKILSKTLHRDMYSLRALGSSIDNVRPPTPDPLATSHYPCVYLIDHLYDSKPKSQVNNVGELQVAEGLSLCKSIAKAINLITKLHDLVQEMCDSEELIKLIDDAHKFVMYHEKTIESYPLQIYASALLFSPTGSVIRKLFQHEELKGIKIKPAMNNGWNNDWSAFPQMFEGHSKGVCSLVFSHNSTKILSASYDQTVKVWDTSSCKLLQTFKGHSNGVRSIAFSHDSTQIASTSSDKTVKIWNTSSGELLRTLKGHSYGVWSVAFSHDSNRIASASVDQTVKIWDTSSGEILQTLKGHSGGVWSVAFSHDSARIASTSSDRTVRIWDTISGKLLQTLKGHRDWVLSVAFSHDSNRIASASDDQTVKIWDTSSGELLQTLRVGKVVLVKTFDSTGFCIHTEDAAIIISNSATPNKTTAITGTQPPEYQYTALSSDKTWITYNSNNILRLPLQYRPLSSAVSGHIIVFGSTSGEVWICDLNPNISYY